MIVSYSEDRVIVRKFNVTAYGSTPGVYMDKEYMDQKDFIQYCSKEERWEIYEINKLKNNKLNQKLYKNKYISFQDKLFIKDENYDEFDGVTYLWCT